MHKDETMKVRLGGFYVYKKGYNVAKMRERVGNAR